MKRIEKRISIGVIVLFCCFMLAGCAGAQGGQQNVGAGSSLNENVSNAYAKLITFKTDDYAQKSVKDFNALLSTEFGELLNALAVVTTADLSVEDENHDFITVTMQASLNELYAEQMDDEKVYFGYLRKERLSEPLNKTEKAIFEIEGPAYEFLFLADYTLKYEVFSLSTLTIGERDNVLRSFGKGMQNYVDSLSEKELTDRTIYKDLSERAEALLEELTPGGMEISCEINIELWSNDEGIESEAFFSDEEYQKLQNLQFDGYKDMSISEFQQKVWALTDTPEYQDLLDRFTKSMTFYGQKDCDETASFYFYVLEPLTAEKWQSWQFDGSATTSFPDPSDQTMLEYVITLTITDANTLTVREYNNTRIEIIKAFQSLISSRTAEEMQNTSEMETAIDNEIERIRQCCNTDAMRVDIEYSYKPLGNDGDTYGSDTSGLDEQEIREIDYGTKEDYDSLLALKTPNFADMSVADFNLKLLDWAEESYERMERINVDCGWNDYQVELSEDEMSFVCLTAYLSGIENGKYVQSLYTGNPEVDYECEKYLSQKLVCDENRCSAWCDLYYRFSYHIMDKKLLTVGERDQCVGGVINDIQVFWDETGIDDLLKMTERDVINVLQGIAAKHSSAQIAVTIREDQVHFESMDERGVAN